jgi:hypothetical protein
MGRISLGISVAVAVLAPRAAWTQAADTLVYTALVPCRIVDTRDTSRLEPGQPRDLVVTGGSCGVPQGTAQAVVINFVAVNAAGPGNLRAWAYTSPPQPPPAASVLNYAAVPGLNVANGIVVAICGGSPAACPFGLRVQADVSATHLVADVMGYFSRLPQGSGSTLNADLLDNLDSTAFAPAAHDHDAAYVNVSGDAMTGALVLPEDGLAVGAAQLFASGGRIGVGTALPETRLHVQAGDVLVRQGNALLTSPFEQGINLRLEGPVGSRVNPEFRLGRIVAAGDSWPEFRALYADAGVPERAVFEFDGKGIVASVKPLAGEPGGGRGSHFEGFLRGDVQPLFRLNSAPAMQLEMGSGGTGCTDTALRRRDDGALTVVGLTASPPDCANPTSADRVVVSASGSLLAVGGFVQPGSGGETLRTVRGNVLGFGLILDGTGFTVQRTDVGTYLITLATPFSGRPTVSVTPIDFGRQGQISVLGNANFTVLMTDTNAVNTDGHFGFLAVGPP